MSANTLAVDLYSEPLPRREGFFVLRVEYVNIVFIMNAPFPSLCMAEANFEHTEMRFTISAIYKLNRSLY